MKPFVKVLVTIAGIVAVYFAAFYLLMDTNDPALNDDMEVVYTCGFRYGGGRTAIPGDKTLAFRGVTFWNTFFYPAERVHNFVTGRENAPRGAQTP